MSLSACDILNKMPLRGGSRRRWATGDKNHCVRSAGTSVSHDAADWGFDGNPSGERRALAGLLIVISQRLICVVLSFCEAS